MRQADAVQEVAPEELCSTRLVLVSFLFQSAALSLRRTSGS